MTPFGFGDGPGPQTVRVLAGWTQNAKAFEASIEQLAARATDDLQGRMWKRLLLRESSVVSTDRVAWTRFDALEGLSQEEVQLWDLGDCW